MFLGGECRKAGLDRDDGKTMLRLETPGKRLRRPQRRFIDVVDHERDAEKICAAL